MNLVANLAGKRNIISRFKNMGLYYDDLFPDFSLKSLAFIDKLTFSSYDSYWPFPDLTLPRRLLPSKIFRKLGSHSSPIYLSRYNKSDLTLLIQDYLRSLFDHFDDNYDVFILNNAFETSSPQSSLCFIPNSYSIVIDRS